MNGVTRFLINWLLAGFFLDRSRWFLWVPVLYAVGIGAYYSVLWHPSLYWCGLPVFLISLLFFRFVRQREGLLIPVLSLAIVTAGFSGAILRTEWVAAPILQKKSISMFTGIVVQKSAGQKSVRLTLAQPEFELASIPDLKTVRVSTRSDVQSLHPGDKISVKAVLLPPPPPAYPGGYDFQRDSYYKQIGAVGYTISRPEIQTRDAVSLRAQISSMSALLRDKINRYILKNSTETSAGFTMAIMTGDRSHMPKSQLEEMRNSGLAHLLAISGLHMGMIGGIIFFAVRLLLSALPILALNHPIKKWSAIVALIGICFYLAVSGMSISAVRAFLMISMVFLAICFDRTALSLRNLALAALLILVFLPETLLSASFQMSFAAVFCLIAGYERWGHLLILKSNQRGVLRRFTYYFLGIFLTSLIASFATAPFAIFHFGQFSVIGVAANLIAVPIMGFWVMPMILIAFCLMPFGLAAVPLELAGDGISMILFIAHYASGFTASVLKVGVLPISGLVVLILAFFWFFIWRHSVRFLALGAAPFILALVLIAERPSILFSQSGALFAINDQKYGTAASTFRSERFERERWTQLLGIQEFERLTNWKTPIFRCDGTGCVYLKNTKVITFLNNAHTIKTDCDRADILISRVPIPKGCRNPSTIVDKFSLWREGGHALYLDEKGNARLETVNSLRGDRPWVPLVYRKWLEVNR
ncbi:MAG: competence protein ComEC [Sneathiella sp.]